MPRLKTLVAAVAAGAALSLLAAAPATAQTDSFRNMDPMKRMDSDRDGRVTREEFNDSNLRRANFIYDFMDANRDGSVTFEEYRQFQEKFSDRRFQRLDTNRDGSLDAREAAAMSTGLGGEPGDAPGGAAAPYGADRPWMGDQPPPMPPAPPQGNGRY
jgi:Ca2+-binding EF-hand superfamily protein